MNRTEHNLIQLKIYQYLKSFIIISSITGLLSAYTPIQKKSDKKQQIVSPILSKVCGNISISESQDICTKSIASLIKIWGESDDVTYKPQGSGVIVKRIKDKSTTTNTQLYKYYVLTSKHIFKDIRKSISILAPDGKVHAIQRNKRNPSYIDELDLSIISFTSMQEYQVLPIKNGFLDSTSDGKESQIDIFVVGYPSCQSEICQEPKFTQGKYGPKKMLLNSNKLKQGYSIPYNNETENGMSGSPILNINGEIIGIHGKGKYGGRSKIPNIPDAYILDKSNTPLSSESEELMKYFSWGIPIELASNLISLESALSKPLNKSFATSTQKRNDFPGEVILVPIALFGFFNTYKFIESRILIAQPNSLCSQRKKEGNKADSNNSEYIENSQNPQLEDKSSSNTEQDIKTDEYTEEVRDSIQEMKDEIQEMRNKIHLQKEEIENENNLARNFIKNIFNTKKE